MVGVVLSWGARLVQGGKGRALAACGVGSWG